MATVPAGVRACVQCACAHTSLAYVRARSIRQEGLRCAANSRWRLHVQRARLGLFGTQIR